MDLNLIVLCPVKHVLVLYVQAAIIQLVGSPKSICIVLIKHAPPIASKANI